MASNMTGGRRDANASGEKIDVIAVVRMRKPRGFRMARTKKEEKK